MMTESGSTSEQIWNIPNKLSAARLVLSFVVFALIPLGAYHSGFYWAALIVFVIAAGTDWVDGWYARKYDQVTQLGRILDPFCDKIIICGTFILIAEAMRGRFEWYSTIAGWMAVVIVGRELLVTALRSFIEQSGGDFSAKMAGKLKMVFQCGAVGACLVALAIRNQDGDFQTGIPTWLLYTMTIFVWLALLSTIYSGVGYIQAAAKRFTT
jgi:CDP-diacylglycerol--glycerol-3-phosphate 3-phosphatidyltransferase